MDKREFIEELGALGIKCLILDDHLINPNEIFIFVCNKEKLICSLRDKNIPLMITHENQKRSIRIISYTELGIAQWRRNLEEKAVFINKSIAAVCEEDCTAVFLYYAFVYVQTKHWLYYNILHVLKERLNLEDEAALATWLARYIRDKKYSIKFKKIVELPEELLQQLSVVERIEMSGNMFWLKLLRRIPLEVLAAKGALHNILTRNRYLKYLQKTSAIGSNWILLNKKAGGSSGCTLIKDVVEGEEYFLKGNELSVYRGLKNEIAIQKKLIKMSQDCSWFLPMLGCDSSERWIRYEFVTWELLSRFLEKCTFSTEELKILGDYLVTVLDKLYDMKIVHNDFRCENIMVKTTESGQLDGFVLADFGCASVEGSFPWDRKTYWGKYFSHTVCGGSRYSEKIVDDAASALSVYLRAGGNYEDSHAVQLRERIGRIFSMNKTDI